MRFADPTVAKTSGMLLAILDEFDASDAPLLLVPPPQDHLTHLLLHLVSPASYYFHRRLRH